ncbi:hybrid sensor histidine kinase/response regulator [Brevibacillus sp. H7]|uniref:hybrid sensor histidine kinase/response regulator n=1 Tax=Brevibacillus sp. H7 TaxID=3349138 RepID=UPI003826A4B5
MINPYLHSGDLERLINFSGIAEFIIELYKQYEDIEEISILNGPAWLKGRKNRVIEPQTDLPILYGSNEYYLPQDREKISLLLETYESQSQTFTRDNLFLRKHYIPLPAQRVLVIVQNEKRLETTIFNLNLFFSGLLLVSGISLVAILWRITRKQIYLLSMERKRLELAEQFKRSMDMLPNLLFKCQRNDQGAISFTYLEGTSLEKMGGKPLMDQLLPYDQVLPLLKRHERELLQAFHGETVQFEINVGEEFYQAVVKPIPLHENADVLGIAGYATDITDRVRLEKELEAARDEALKLSQAKSTFLAMMSHELRTPLHSTLGMLELLQQTTLTTTQREYLHTAQTAGNALLVLINDLLDLTRLEFGKIPLNKRSFSISTFMKEAAQLLTVLGEKKGLSLTYSVSSSVPPVVVGDSDRLRQILVNLIGNAIKYTEQGSVRVHLERVGGTEDEATLLFTIRDTGIGIAREHIETIFEQFSQADSSISRQFGGSGLGLTISKHLIEKMGGTISVESEPGMGSTFSFTLTLGVSTEASVEQAVEKQEVSPVDMESVRILLVDDSQENRKLIKVFLSKLPVQVDEAEDGQRAVELFQSKPYDVVLMDIQMPIMDGYSVTQAIRRWEMENGRSPTPVIALTAHALPEDIQRSVEAGCTAHLSKPFTKQAFYSCLGRYIPIHLQYLK